MKEIRKKGEEKFGRKRGVLTFLYFFLSRAFRQVVYDREFPGSQRPGKKKTLSNRFLRKRGTV